MIAVIGSVHDRVAASVVDSWPSARLVSAEDLTSPGWAWSSDGNSRRWVISGEIVEDEDVTGVFIRRSNLYPEELLSIHPEDRAYLAGEAHAFLIAVLATTRAVVVNPVTDAALADEALRPERWMWLAADAGLDLSPIRLTSRKSRQRISKQQHIQVVGRTSFGEAPAKLKAGAVELVGMLGLHWATCIFDNRNRLLAMTTAVAPSERASHALARLLASHPS